VAPARCFAALFAVSLFAQLPEPSARQRQIMDQVWNGAAERMKAPEIASPLLDTVERAFSR
jgi:hypothetical protein